MQLTPLMALFLVLLMAHPVRAEEPSDEVDHLAVAAVLMRDGHYDRALSKLREQGRVFVCGLAFFGQEFEQVPAEAHDVPLDWVMTERGSIPLFMMRAMAENAPDS